MDLLEETFVIFQTASFSTNPRKEIAKSRRCSSGYGNPERLAPARCRLTNFGGTSGRCGEKWAIAEVPNSTLARSPRNCASGAPGDASGVDLVVRLGRPPAGL